MSQTSLKPNQAMALSQLYTNAITDEALLEVLASTPREMFVPTHLHDCAYIDEDLNRQLTNKKDLEETLQKDNKLMRENLDALKKQFSDQQELEQKKQEKTGDCRLPIN